jgi:aconitase A
MIAIGVGGADAVDAMTGTPWELKAPQIVGESTNCKGWQLSKRTI